MRALSQLDLQRWAVEVAVEAGLAQPGNLVLTIWGHDDGCPMHPAAHKRLTAASRCRCAPDCTAVVNPGDVDERRVVLILDGLPVERPAGRGSAADPKPS